MPVELGIFFVAFAVLGLVLRSRFALLCGLLCVPSVWLLVYAGAVGDGVGGEWQPIAVAQTVASALGAAVGVVAGRRAYGPVRREPPRSP